MSIRLHLHEGQYLKLNALNRAHGAQVAKINQQYRADAVIRQAKLAELEAQYQQVYRQLLTPAQLSLLNAEPEPASAEPGNGRG